MGMVQIRHFEFLCQSMSIEPLVDRFWVFYLLHCSLGFYSFMQHSLVKKILLTPPKSFHEWKSKFFFIKSGVIPVKTDFRGVEEIPPETLEAPVIKIWYQDIKEIPSIDLPKRALVATKMSLFWKAVHHDKLVYIEDKTNVTLYIVAYQREKGKMTTFQLDAGDKPWYHQMVKNFTLPKDTDLEAQSSADVDKKKGTRLVSNSWCDYIVVSNSLEGLAHVAVKQPKVEPRDTADIPESNRDDPIDVESSPETLVRTRAVKRKKPEGGAPTQPVKKITRRNIGKKGNLDAFATKLSQENLVHPLKRKHYQLLMMIAPCLPPP
ncbi:hypothetical protein HanHA89_Chr02g0054221 [Helianthus annuus]|nr:hypothetical protein HanHA89_Chr02g0054221 [Helianthus annuus]